MDDRSISIELAGRAYPLTVQADEEQNIRAAATSINESIARLKGQYPMTDKMDLLAMAALEVTTRAMNMAATQEHTEIAEAVSQLERSLAKVHG